MGGPVNIAVRLDDGKVISKDCYTSGISALFDNDRFFRGDIFLLNELLVGLDNAPLAPDGYGLVVGDYQTQTIYSMQHYTNVGEFGIAGIMISMNGMITTDNEEFLDHVRFMRLLKQGYISLAKLYDSELTVIRVENNEHGLSLLNKYKKSFGSFIVDYPKWKVINFDESVEGIVEFKQKLEDIGFNLNSSDNAMWDSFLLDRMELEAEDE